MKSCVCAILLLMCMGLATQVLGQCLFRNKILQEGQQTTFLCMKVECLGGHIVYTTCDGQRRCGNEEYIIGYTDIDNNKVFPDCCPQPICRKAIVYRPDAQYLLPSYV